MADNITAKANTGAGTEILAADEISAGVWAPRSKIMLGADGANDGDVSRTNPMPVDAMSRTATGTISALNGAVSLSVDGDAGAAIDLRGTFTATVTFQGTIDGTNWFNLQATPVASAQNVALVATATAAGAWYVQCAGCVQIRATATAYTSGTITAVLRAVESAAWVYAAVTGSTNSVAIANGTVTTVTTVSSQTPVAPTVHTLNSAATTNATSVKASAGTIWSIAVSNTNAAARFLKLYNKASAPTVGTDTPIMVVPIPATGFVTVDGGANGLRCGTGIAYALTTAMADSDTGAVAAGEVKVFINYT